MRTIALAPMVGAITLALVVGHKAAAANGDDGQVFHFVPGTLVLSRSVEAGGASSVTIGQTLPPNCVPGTITLPLLAGGTTTVTIPAGSSSGCNTAVADGSYPTVLTMTRRTAVSASPLPFFSTTSLPTGGCSTRVRFPRSFWSQASAQSPSLPFTSLSTGDPSPLRRSSPRRGFRARASQRRRMISRC